MKLRKTEALLDAHLIYNLFFFAHTMLKNLKTQKKNKNISTLRSKVAQSELDLCKVFSSN